MNYQFVPRNNTVRVLLGAAVALILFFSFQGVPDLPPQLSLNRQEIHTPQQGPSMEDSIAALYRPLVHPFNASLKLGLGPEFPAPKSIFTEPLGKRLCIIDADTRTQDEAAQIWNEKTLNYTALEKLSAGILNHYLYAKVHGYDYKFVRTVGYEDRAAPWAKLPAMASILKDYDFLVIVDEDVIFPNLHVPYEWMLNHWNFNEEIFVAMSQEPVMSWWEGSYDVHGKLNQNAGFITLRNTPTTFEMLDRWIRCPEETRYEGCAKLKKGWPAEQGAFNNFIRYDYASAVREIDCNEGLGWPEFEPCRGWLMQHYTLRKRDLKHALEGSFMNGFLTLVHDNMIREKNSTYYVMNQSEKTDGEEFEETES